VNGGKCFVFIVIILKNKTTKKTAKISFNDHSAAILEREVVLEEYNEINTFEVRYLIIINS